MSLPHGKETQGAPLSIVLFHSALGLRPSVLEWGDRLRAEGHRVITPDLYDGEVFDDIDAGMSKVERMGGIPALMMKTMEAVADLPSDLVYAGFSNGAGSAEFLAATRPGARGAILMHGALPIQAFEASAWPTSVPVQLHYAKRDPRHEQESVDAFASSVRESGARYEAFDYPVTGHLFADRDDADFDAAAADAMFERVSSFLRQLRT